MRHYLQDVGSTFGTGANGPREYDEGWELLYDGGLTRKRLVRLGFVFEPWQTAQYVDNPAIGRFEGDSFDPQEWRPRVGTAAFFHARADDNFWAARRVVAFTDDMIRSAVRAGRYSDTAAEALLVDVLIKRRQKIAAAYLPAINPLVDFALSGDWPSHLPQRGSGRERGVSANRRLQRELGRVRQRDGPDAIAGISHDVALERHPRAATASLVDGRVRASPGVRDRTHS